MHVERAYVPTCVIILVIVVIVVILVIAFIPIIQSYKLTQYYINHKLLKSTDWKNILVNSVILAFINITRVLVLLSFQSCQPLNPIIIVIQGILVILVTLVLPVISVNLDILVTLVILVFRAEKRSAQASAHPLPQAQGGLFCVLTVFVCCWSSEWNARGAIVTSL